MDERVQRGLPSSTTATVTPFPVIPVRLGGVAACTLVPQASDIQVPARPDGVVLRVSEQREYYQVSLPSIAWAVEAVRYALG